MAASILIITLVFGSPPTSRNYMPIHTRRDNDQSMKIIDRQVAATSQTYAFATEYFQICVDYPTFQARTASTMV